MSKSDILVRAATNEDCGDLLTIHQRAILSIDASIYTTAEIKSWAADKSESDFRSAMHDGEFFELALLPASHPVVGFCSRIEDRVKGLYVDPNHSRRGVGRFLLQRAEAAIGAVRHDTVKVHASLSGQRFYERCGYALLREERIRTRGGLLIKTAHMCKDLR